MTVTIFWGTIIIILNEDETVIVYSWLIDVNDFSWWPWQTVTWWWLNWWSIDYIYICNYLYNSIQWKHGKTKLQETIPIINNLGSRRIIPVIVVYYCVYLASHWINQTRWLRIGTATPSIAINGILHLHSRACLRDISWFVNRDPYELSHVLVHNPRQTT